MSRWHKHEFDFLPAQAFMPREGRRGGMPLHGGKGNDAPAPDPRLIEAQIKSLGVQDSAIQSILDLSRELQPQQREQLEFGLDSARTAFTQSQEDRTYGLGRRAALTGLQDRTVADAATFNTENRRDELAGEAVGDVRQAFGTAKASQARDLARMGVNPSDGRRAAFDNQFSVSEALASASAANKTRQAARAEGYGLTDRAINPLAGYPAFGVQTTGAGAQFGASGVGIAGAGQAALMAGNKSAAEVAGQMGTNATGAFNAQANYQASMQEQDQTGSILGGLGGLAVGAAKLGAFSDRRLKQDVELVGKDEATGLNLYEFSYIDDPDLARYVGVMADEVRPLFPDAVQRDANGMDRVNYQMLGIEFKEAA